MKKKQEKELVVVHPIERKKVIVPIRGLSPLICHQMSAKVKKKMLDDMTGNKQPRTAKDPEAEFQGGRYRFAEMFDGSDPTKHDGFPAIGLKKAMIRAGKLVGLVMTDLRQMFFVCGDGVGEDGTELVKIRGKARMREDGVRVGTGGSGGANDLRYRPEYRDWSAEILIDYDHNVINAEQIFNLVNRAGFSVGLCEWRPEKDGQFGRFEVVAKTAKNKRGGKAA